MRETHALPREVHGVGGMLAPPHKEEKERRERWHPDSSPQLQQRGAVAMSCHLLYYHPQTGRETEKRKGRIPENLKLGGEEEEDV